MFCSKCGTDVTGSKFCAKCGEMVQAASANTAKKEGKNNALIFLVFGLIGVIVVLLVLFLVMFLNNNRNTTADWYGNDVSRGDGNVNAWAENENEATGGTGMQSDAERPTEPEQGEQGEQGDFTQPPGPEPEPESAPEPEPEPTDFDMPTDFDAPLDMTELNGGMIHPVRNFGGRILRVGAWWEWPIGEMMMPNDFQSEPNRATDPNYPINRMRWDNARRVEELFNVRFESVVIDFENFMPVLTNTVATGEPFADIVILTGTMQMEAMGSLIQPWNVNLPNSDVFGGQIYARPVTMDNRYTWAINPLGGDIGGMGIGVNLDIINAMDLPNPVHLYQSGRWTWDAMLDIMRRATRDTTGDGVNDQFGISGQPGDIIMHLIAANDGVLVDSNFNYGLSHPNTIAALEFSRQIFSERLWYPERGGMMNTEDWVRNFYSYSDGVSALFPIVTWAIGNEPINFNYAFVPFPTGPNNTSGSTWMRETQQGICVAAGTSWDVADILIILEELFAWPGNEPELLFETDAVNWMREVYPSEADVRRALHAGATGRADIGRDIISADGEGYFWVLGNFAAAFWNDEMDVMQAVEFYRSRQQRVLDERFR